MSERTNYDQVADRYDNQRYRGKEPDLDLAAFLTEQSGPDTNALRILDLGCGTGSQLVANESLISAGRMVGLDRSAGMLAQARPKAPEIAWVQGDATRLPFKEASFDYISNQFSYHHVPDKAALVAQVWRVLRPDGRFAISNVCIHGMPGWALYHYFPAAWERDLQDFLPNEAIKQLFEHAGFHNVTINQRHWTETEDLHQLLTEARQRTTSQLTMISEFDYQAGLHRMEAELSIATGDVVIVPSEVCLVTIVGNKLPPED
jgi:SAM-dependent methyltransferase